MVTEINLADLKVGDEVPADAVIREMYLPVWTAEGQCEFLRLVNVPVAAFV
jgi:hypothetical protein